MNEAGRIARNAQRFTELDAIFARRCERIFTELEAQNLRPRAQIAWRSPEDQLEAVRTGHSEVRWGFHNATRADGTPEALALDIVDDDHPLNAPRSFVLRVSIAALHQTCKTGADFGLPLVQKRIFWRAMAEGDTAYKGPLGWDSLHIQPADLTMAEARRGVRLAA